MFAGQFPSESPSGPITDVTSPSQDSPVRDGSPSIPDSNVRHKGSLYRGAETE